MHEGDRVMIYNAKIEQVDGVYAVEFPDIKGCYSQGDSLQESLKMAQEALNGHLSSLIKNNFEIPVATYKNGYPIQVLSEVSFALQLRKLRGKRTQQEAAELLGIRQQAYRKLEDVKNTNPRLLTIEKVVERLGGRFEIRIG
jgi:antitoxin HicB